MAFARFGDRADAASGMFVDVLPFGLGEDPIADRGGVIGAAVGDEDDLDVVLVLVEVEDRLLAQGGQGFGNAGGFVVGEDADGDVVYDRLGVEIWVGASGGDLGWGERPLARTGIGAIAQN
jgi:hypothetical protein